MALVIPDGFGRVSLAFLTLGSGVDDEFITFGINDRPADDPNEIAHDVYDAFVTAFSDPDPVWSETGVLSKATCVFKRGATIIDGEHNEDTPGAGVFESPTPATCLLVKKSTAAGGRKNRGRCYLPHWFLGEVDIDSLGFIDPTAVSDTTDRWQAFIVALAVLDNTMVILHADGTTPTGVVSGNAERVVATQRRRQDR